MTMTATKKAAIKKLFPETVGRSTIEDGIGVYRGPKAQAMYDKARDQIAPTVRQRRLRRIVRRQAKKPAAPAFVRASVYVGPTSHTYYPGPKADAIRFEDSPYWRAYRRPAAI